MSKVFCRIVRENDRNTNRFGKPSKGRPIGVVVATENKKCGVAFWNYNNGGVIDLKFLRELAVGRAVLEDSVKIPNREVELPEAPGVFVSMQSLVEGHLSKIRRQVDSSYFVR